MKNKRKMGGTKIIIYLTLIIYVGYILFQQQMYLLACKKEENYFSDEIKKQKQISEKLEKQKEFYETDAYIEKMAREKLGMVFLDEKIFVDISK